MNGIETIVAQNKVAEAKTAKCEKCAAEFKQAAGRGRPRKFCSTCRPARVKTTSTTPQA